MTMIGGCRNVTALAVVLHLVGTNRQAAAGEHARQALRLAHHHRADHRQERQQQQRGNGPAAPTVLQTFPQRRTAGGQLEPSCNWHRRRWGKHGDPHGGSGSTVGAIYVPVLRPEGRPFGAVKTHALFGFNGQLETNARVGLDQQPRPAPSFCFRCIEGDAVTFQRFSGTSSPGEGTVVMDPTTRGWPHLQ